jgi:hypothetical protein
MEEVADSVGVGDREVPNDGDTEKEGEGEGVTVGDVE